MILGVVTPDIMTSPACLVLPGDTSFSQLTESLWAIQLSAANMLLAPPDCPQRGAILTQRILPLCAVKRRSVGTISLGQHDCDQVAAAEELAHSSDLYPVKTNWNNEVALARWSSEGGTGRVGSEGTRCSLVSLSSEAQLNDEVSAVYEVSSHHCSYCSVYATLTPQWDACRQALPTPPISLYIMNDLIG